MPKQRGKFRTKAEELALRLVVGVIGLFPLRASMAIGENLGKATVALFPRLSKTAIRNLEIAFPNISDSEKRRIAKGTFRSLGRQLGFVSHFKRFAHEDIRNNVEVIGENENFRGPMESDRGVILFTGHFGSWEVFNLLPGAFGYDLNILVRRIDNPNVEKYVDSLRTRFGAVTLGKKEARRGMYRLLEEGKALGILADLNAQHRDGVFVDFFGVPASTTASIAKLALKTDAIILPAFAVWEESKGRYVVYLEPAIEFEKTGDTEKDILQITQKITEIVERFVREYPEQWLWIHKRWNTRPKGQKGIY